MIFGKWFYVELGGLVLPLAFIFEIWHVHCRRDVGTPPPLMLFLLLCCCCAAAGVLLVWCACGGFDGGGSAAVAFV